MCSTHAQLDHLLIKARSGDHEAAAAFYLEAAPRLYGWAVKNRGLQAQDAEDLIQGVLAVAFDPGTLYEPRGMPLSWLFGIAKHLVPKARPLPKPPESNPQRTAPSDLATIDEERERLESCIKEAIGQLDEKWRDALTKKCSEVAAEYSVSARAVASWKKEARKAVARHIQRQVPDIYEAYKRYMRRYLEGFDD